MGYPAVKEPSTDTKSRIEGGVDAFIDQCEAGRYSLQEKGIRNVGMEYELFCLNQNYMPDWQAYQTLDRLPGWQSELSSCCVEFTGIPKPLKNLKYPFLGLQRSQEDAIRILQDGGLKPIASGLLLTARPEDFNSEYAMNPVKPRYPVLRNQWRSQFTANNGSVEMNFPGHSNVMVSDCLCEGIMGSFQTHIQIEPGEAANALNTANFIGAAAESFACGSPRFYGKTGLYADYRKPFWRGLFPDRTGVPFDWAKTLRDVVSDGINLPCWFTPDLPEFEESDQINLEHLKTALGCIWRDRRLKIHENCLTIEERTTAAGTPKDNTAFATFWTGLMRYYLDNDPEAWKNFAGSIEVAEKNSMLVAQYGLNAEIQWFGRTRLVKELILTELLELARKGHKDLTDPEVCPYLKIVKKIVESGQTKAEWIRKMATKLENEGKNPIMVDQALSAFMIRYQDSSVADWKI